MTNKEFSETNEHFIEACERVDIKPTVRQASKWRNHKGLAYKGRENES